MLIFLQRDRQARWWDPSSAVCPALRSLGGCARRSTWHQQCGGSVGSRCGSRRSGKMYRFSHAELEKLVRISLVTSRVNHGQWVSWMSFCYAIEAKDHVGTFFSISYLGSCLRVLLLQSQWLLPLPESEACRCNLKYQNKFVYVYFF